MTHKFIPPSSAPIRISGRNNTLSPAETLRFDARHHGKTGRIDPMPREPHPIAVIKWRLLLLVALAWAPALAVYEFVEVMVR